MVRGSTRPLSRLLDSWSSSRVLSVPYQLADRGITVRDETTSLDAELDRAVLVYCERFDVDGIELAQQRRAALAYVERFTPGELPRAH
jgi:hypothetical protein